MEIADLLNAEVMNDCLAIIACLVHCSSFKILQKIFKDFAKSSPAVWQHYLTTHFIDIRANKTNLMSPAVVVAIKIFLISLTQAFDFIDVKSLLGRHEEYHSGQLEAVRDDGDEDRDCQDYPAEARLRVVVTENCVELLRSQPR